MQSSCSATSVACRATGCKGRVIITGDTAITLRVGCHATDSAYPCMACGRLHWHSGNLVFNRQHQAAFYDSQIGIQNRDMNAGDKLAFVQGMIDGAKHNGDVLVMTSIAGDLLATLGQKHAEDCAANQLNGQCTCGVTEITDFSESLK